MKNFKAYTLFLLIFCYPTLSFSQTTEPTHWNKPGFFLGTELAAFISPEIDPPGVPGKIDLLIGYQLTPKVSIAADLWTFWFIGYSAEAHVKVNFNEAKISPYAVGTVGIAGLVNVFNDSSNNVFSFLTYSAGFGGDFHLWKRTVLFTEARYRGGLKLESNQSDQMAHALELGVGLRWHF